MAPVHEDVVQRAVKAEFREVAASLAEKGGEFGPVHLARGHREWPVMDRAEAARVTVDPHVVGRVGDDRRGTFLAHQCGERRDIESAAAQQAIATEHPQIPDLADRRLRREFGQRIGWIVSLVRHILK